MIRVILAGLSLSLVLPAASWAADDAPVAAVPAPKLSAAEERALKLDRLFAQLRKAGSSDEAENSEQAIWRLWMAYDSPTAEVLLVQGTRAMENKEFKAAHGIFDRLVEVHPLYVEAWNKRATLLFLEGRFDESVADIAKVLDLEPRHFGALSGLGMIRRTQGDRAGALRAFKDALAVNPTMPGVIQAIEELGGQETPI
jgi:tetratricopeptide (TPR) repeat protein